MEVTNIENQDVELQKKIKKVFEGSHEHQNSCPIRDIMDRFGDKWSMYAIIYLGVNEVMRFNELKHKIEGISQRMLTVTLRSLEQDGLVVRTIYPQIPPKVEYRLSPLGLDLMKQLITLAEWSTINMDKILAARQAYEKTQS